MIHLKPFYFMRHGQTDYNKAHRYMGSLDIPLNAHGEQQAYDALETFKGIPINRIISSPLKRAHRTAEIVATHYSLLLQTTDLLKEANWGMLEGQPITDSEMFEKWRQGAALEQGESFNDVKYRVHIALQQIFFEYNEPLIIAHGGIYWAILELLGLPYCDATNCQIVYFSPVGNACDKWVSAVL